MKNYLKCCQSGFLHCFFISGISLLLQSCVLHGITKKSISFLFSEEKVSLFGICNSVNTWSWQKLAFVIGEKVFKNRVFEVLIHICVQNSKMQKTGSVFLKCKAQNHRLIRIVSSAFVVIRAYLFQFSSLMTEQQLG